MDNLSQLENSKLGGVTDPTIRISDKVTIVTADGEGLVFALNTRKTFWVNGSAAFLLELLQKDSEGLSLSSIKKAVDNQYNISEEKAVFSDIVSFFNQMENLDIISYSEISMNNVIIDNSNEFSSSYVKPIIKEETESKHRQTAGYFAAAYFGTH